MRASVDILYITARLIDNRLAIMVLEYFPLPEDSLVYIYRHRLCL